MRAMILAAGRGKRLQPITDVCPKPLVAVGGKPLIVYHLENLQRAGITEIVINLAHLGAKIEAYLGNGATWGVEIAYSWENPCLDVGGGIFNALPLLGKDPFIIINGDIWTDFPLTTLPQFPKALAHLVMVDNPPQHLTGDFALEQNGQLKRHPGGATYTYSGISVLRPALFQHCTGGAFPLAPLLDKAASESNLSGEHYAGRWTDVGTIERLQNLENALMHSSPQKMPL